MALLVAAPQCTEVDCTFLTACGELLLRVGNCRVGRMRAYASVWSPLSALASVLLDASGSWPHFGILRAKETNKSSLIPHQLRGSALEALEHRCAVGARCFGYCSLTAGFATVIRVQRLTICEI